MFHEPGVEFFDSWISFIVLSVIFIGALYLVGQFLETRSGRKTENILRKVIYFITYPVYLLRSMLPHRGQEVFDGFLLLLYCVGAGWLVIYSVS